MEIKKIKIEPPEGVNIICGQTHFIKTAEDLYEALVNSVPRIKFGIAFCEASGPCLVRYEGNEVSLIELARDYAYRIGAGHFFIIFIKDAFPINVLDRIKSCPEVLNIFCATANPVEILFVEDEQGRGVLGVIDGFATKGIEDEKARKERYDFLRKIGYKLSD
uniref:Adenosine monophosphate-protein transferase n=1 Tax=candidate division WOR-3 bacterium TaxID=2052148 RepID=A0A7C4XM36_UNCW3